MRRGCLTLMVLLAAHSALAQSPEEITRPGPLGATADEIPTVTVEAPEPRFVAPTLRDRIGRIWAPVLINGKGPFRLVLDTGANSSAIIPAVADSLGLSPQATKVKLNGVTGSAMVPIVMAEQMEIGELLIQGVSLPIVPDVFGGAEGVLGATGLVDKRIFIDFGQDLIRISRSQGQRMPQGFTRVPITANRQQLLMFNIRIGAVKTKAILDTAAQQTFGNSALRELLLRNPKRGRDEELIGVTLDVAQGKSVGIPPINLGDIQVRNMRVNFSDMHIFERWNLTKAPVLVIGMDVIGTLDVVVIDYKLRELQLRAKYKGPVFDDSSRSRIKS